MDNIKNLYGAQMSNFVFDENGQIYGKDSENNLLLFSSSASNFNTIFQNTLKKIESVTKEFNETGIANPIVDDKKYPKTPEAK